MDTTYEKISVDMFSVIRIH